MTTVTEEKGAQSRSFDSRAMDNENKNRARGEIREIIYCPRGDHLGTGNFVSGPSLIGWKILLPVDLLAKPAIYIPQTAGQTSLTPHDGMLIDLVEQFEPARQFAISEIHQGRFPIVVSLQLCGRSFRMAQILGFFFFWNIA